jgi:hypothetical protein
MNKSARNALQQGVALNSRRVPMVPHLATLCVCQEAMGNQALCTAAACLSMHCCCRHELPDEQHSKPVGIAPALQTRKPAVCLFMYCCRRYELPDEDLKGRLELKIFDNVGKGVSGAAGCTAVHHQHGCRTTLYTRS